MLSLYRLLAQRTCSNFGVLSSHRPSHPVDAKAWLLGMCHRPTLSRPGFSYKRHRRQTSNPPVLSFFIEDNPNTQTNLPSQPAQTSQHYLHLSPPPRSISPKMMSLIRASTSTSTNAVAKRFISNSARANAAVTINHVAAPSTLASAKAAANGSKTAKAITYTVLGSTVVVAGASHLLKDEVVYWTPNK